MIETLKFMTRTAMFDRKAATALEYALIASALAAVTLAGFRLFFSKINELIIGVAVS